MKFYVFPMLLKKILYIFFYYKTKWTNVKRYQQKGCETLGVVVKNYQAATNQVAYILNGVEQSQTMSTKIEQKINFEVGGDVVGSTITQKSTTRSIVANVSGFESAVRNDIDAILKQFYESSISSDASSENDAFALPSAGAKNDLIETLQMTMVKNKNRPKSYY